MNTLHEKSSFGIHVILDPGGHVGPFRTLKRIFFQMIRIYDFTLYCVCVQCFECFLEFLSKSSI